MYRDSVIIREPVFAFHVGGSRLARLALQRDRKECSLSVAILIGLVGPVDSHPDILGLLWSELRELRTELP